MNEHVNPKKHDRSLSAESEPELIFVHQNAFVHVDEAPVSIDLLPTYVNDAALFSEVASLSAVHFLHKSRHLSLLASVSPKWPSKRRCVHAMSTFHIPQHSSYRIGPEGGPRQAQNGRRNEMAAGKTGLKQKFDSKSDGEKAAEAQHDKIVYSNINVNFIERFTSMWQS